MLLKDQQLQCALSEMVWNTAQNCQSLMRGEGKFQRFSSLGRSDQNQKKYRRRLALFARSFLQTVVFRKQLDYCLIPSPGLDLLIRSQARPCSSLHAQWKPGLIQKNSDVRSLLSMPSSPSLPTDTPGKSHLLHNTPTLTTSPIAVA